MDIIKNEKGTYIHTLDYVKKYGTNLDSLHSAFYREKKLGINSDTFLKRGTKLYVRTNEKDKELKEIALLKKLEKEGRALFGNDNADFINAVRVELGVTFERVYDYLLNGSFVQKEPRTKFIKALRKAIAKQKKALATKKEYVHEISPIKERKLARKRSILEHRKANLEKKANILRAQIAKIEAKL